MDIVSVKNLNKTFKIPSGDVSALKNINLDIPQGEFLALLGPNGAGKSTLIKILIGVLAYDSGNVQVMGYEPLKDRDKVIGRLGIVFGQRSRMWHDLPVKESFELTKRLYLSGYPSTKDKELVEWEKFLIESIDIGHLLNRQVKKLSLGEKMRCELVNTLLYNPDLIFLDEPTIGLDVVSKQRIRDALKILHEKGKTILLTSHDTGDIEKLCQRVIVINRGEVVVDLGINEFMKLSDELDITVKLKSKAVKDTDKIFGKHEVQVTQVSPYELRVTGKKEELNEIMKIIFQKLPVADIDINSEKVEKILIDIYQK